MFLTMFFKMQNIGQTMHLTMLIAHPYWGRKISAMKKVAMANIDKVTYCIELLAGQLKTSDLVVGVGD